MSRTLMLVALAGLLLLARPGAMAAAPPSLSALRVPPLASTERGEYRALEARSGTELWRTRWTITHEEAGDAHRVRVTEDGAGRRGTPAVTRWAVVIDMRAAAAAGSFVARKETRDAAGRLVTTQTRTIDYAAGSGQSVTEDHETGERRTTRFAAGEDAIPTEILSAQLRLLPSTAGRTTRFHLVTRDGTVWPMTATIEGEEDVTTPAGTFRCYKTELRLDSLAGRVARLFLPRLYLWHTVASPHMWVKYRGLDGGLGTPEVIMELVSFSASN